ncbi:solute carrier family 45 member 3 [Polypterus senegalus]|uniref:solute carrier family 45 member 3 n=1 Tax=Polypterus senegalus TaxID=55291 RepID=UPI0019642882|nr:solute carrier family 45 member 3 [Polypterus senegalus]XP_039604444.1 solute carrier family 45 member 3 [Polypterus senegalus]XP_039604445.1 solute carrier family 45 member 3 [Polypterus senegalus]XP_039604446.1 solute carrier family 45 member 3 [Polypterus senegalus]XP_039604447.1 solute carrier family 45 member 3 [Polypterus senegalus]XP_039604448.1 solute carrier family 45 member 3 [Polypterus senegalus]XP_039604449.1 solute carrier family 45 member 3 [Polypterus senegalus]
MVLWHVPLLQNRKMQLLLVNMLTFGLEVCMATGTTYVPPLLLEAGVSEQFMTMVLAVGPILGLIFVPLIGSASDHWTGRFGRRRPFIWMLCAGVFLSLLIIPHVSQLAQWLSIKTQGLEVTLLIIGICLMEFCGQSCFTPLEALVSDLFQNGDECQRAFSVYSFMISLGGCIGYLLPAINWNNSPLVPFVGGTQAFLFLLLTVIFLVCLMGTMFVSEEVFKTETQEISEREMCTYHCLPLFRSRTLLSSGKSCLSVVPQLSQLFRRTPKVIRQLFIAELCSWMALMTFIMFYTDFVGEGLYKGVPNAKPGSEERQRYDEGVRMGSLGLFLQCAISLVFSTFMEKLVKKLGTKIIYLSSVTFLVFATLVMCLSQSIILVSAMAGLTGYTFCTLQILPYTLTSLYHSEKQIFFPRHKAVGGVIQQSDNKKGSSNMNRHTVSHKTSYPNGHPGGMPSPSLSTSTPEFHSSITVNHSSLGAATTPQVNRGICFDLAILDSAFLLSQVVPSLLMGTIVKFTHSVAAYMGCASAIGIVAIYFSTKVIFDKNDLDQ